VCFVLVRCFRLGYFLQRVGKRTIENPSDEREEIEGLDIYEACDAGSYPDFASAKELIEK